MNRTDADSWDLASSVGATATMVAAARTLASREADPLIDDPFAAAAGAGGGHRLLHKLIDGEITLGRRGRGDVARLMTDVMAVRTRFFDDFFTEAAPPASARR